jgi:murein DD-endopeptidase MepM/ murein hydrolase activator NlpD
MRYRYRIEESRERRIAFMKLIRRLAIFSLLLLVFYTIYLISGGRPQLSEESLKRLSLLPARKTIELEFSKPVSSIRVVVEQEGKERPLLYEKLSAPVSRINLDFDTRRLELKDGEALLKIELSSGLFSKRSYSLKTQIDTKPPALQILAYTPYVRQGGTGAIKVKAEEGASVYLKFNEHTYTFYPAEKGYFLLLFPIRLDDSSASQVYVEALDPAGNSARQSLNLRIKEVKFKEDHIELTEDFINRAIYPLLGDEGRSLSPLDAFKRIHEDWRRENIKKVEELGKRSEPKALWEGAFLQLPNSKVLAGYGDIRHYYHKGQLVSESRHMGYDFASVAQAPVPASNSGIVAFAGFLGIYGNTVIVDHGFGLMSLYGHLSEMTVKEGQYVKKGQTIGRTGATGLALGDHLHFGIIVQGYEVNPTEWLDPAWIERVIMPVLKER